MNTEPHAVYRMYSASGDLLYVGMSANPTRRLSEHNSKYGRRAQVCRVEIEWFGCLADAARAEADQISQLAPRDNVAPGRFCAAGVRGGMQNIRHPELLKKIDAFLAQTGMGEKYFGKASTGNSEVVPRIRSGGRVWPETEAKLVEFMAQRLAKVS